MDKNRINDLLAQRILVLDGATGTMIQRFKLQEADFRGSVFTNHTLSLKGNNDLLVLTRPDVIESIHRDYLKAGPISSKPTLLMQRLYRSRNTERRAGLRK
jgi:methionine synthase (B12-dependent) (EC 2.1.1.13)